jgi:hypothetical protein
LDVDPDRDGVHGNPLADTRTFCLGRAAAARLSRDDRPRRDVAGTARTDAYVRVDPELVWQEPTAERIVVRCGVCAVIATFAMQTAGGRPILTCELHIFDVRVLLTGFVVRFVS